MQPLTKLTRRIKKINSLLCVGLDPDGDSVFAFNSRIIKQTHQFVCAFKPNLAFYEQRGEAGMRELRLTMELLREQYPDIFTIADVKRGDIGSTNEAYARAIFDELGFDAITLHPYTGREALQPFLERTDKISIILCRTSNPGGGEFQNIVDADSNQPLWKVVAKRVASDWNGAKNCMLVVGATYPQDLVEVRELVGEMPLLIPGVGAQGGKVSEVVPAGQTKSGGGLVINVGRSIIFDENPAQKAKEFQQEINSYRARIQATDRARTALR